MKNLVLGIDVGGTNVKLGLTDRAGRVVARNSFPTKSYIRSKSKLIGAVVTEAQALLASLKIAKSRIAGVGIGLPGLVDPYKGIVKFLPNIPGWKNVPLAQIIRQKLHLPTYIENDVNLITLGEWKFGAGVGRKNLICITLGTGVGGGLVFDNKLYRGEGFVAGEIGHVPLNETGPDCNCGGFACLEREVGNKTLLARAARVFNKKGMAIQEIFPLASRGDQRALRFWEETGTHIGNALTGVVNLLNPSLIIIGGGISNNQQFLFPTIEKVIKRRAMKVQGAMFRIVRAKLEDDAGIVGAQVLVREGFSQVQAENRLGHRIY